MHHLVAMPVERWVEYLEIRVQGLGFRVSGFGFRD